MEIKRSFLIKLVAEEVQSALREFSHGDGETKKKSKGKRPDTKDASDEPSKKRGPGRPKGSKNKDAPPPGDAAAGADEDPGPVQDPVAMGDGEYGMDDEDDTELPGDEEVAADNADADSDEMDALDADGDAGTEDDGAVGEIDAEMAGRTVGSITLEPESELLPGSREVVITFSDSPDVLRILVDDVGNIVFNWNGKMYDIP